MTERERGHMTQHWILWYDSTPT